MIRTTQQYFRAEKTVKRCIGLRWRLLDDLANAARQGRKQHELDKLQREIDILQWQAQQVTKQMKEYVSLQTGRTLPPDLSDTIQLPANLIRARIAAGWSPNQLAERLDVVASQVYRWESTLYKGASLSVVLKIAEILNGALKQQERPATMLGQPLKLGSDWFDRDFRELNESEFDDLLIYEIDRSACDYQTF
jgi:transcriptional regulator with XRE-family HTH domain